MNPNPHAATPASLPTPGVSEVHQRNRRRAALGLSAAWAGLSMGCAAPGAQDGLASANGRPAQETGFLNRQVQVDGQLHRYQVYVPADYSPARAWPVIVFLHGSGESGRDGLLQTEIGLASALRRHPARYPAIVVFPQTPSPESAHALTAAISLAALARTQSEFRCDAQQVLLTGMSMGGAGSIYLAYHHGERFAALLAVCGWVGRPGNEMAAMPLPAGQTLFDVVAQRLMQQRLPVYLVHGDADTVVPVAQSRQLHAALQARGAAVTYKELAGGNHNAWDPAYRNEAIAAWLMAQRRV